MYVCISPHCEGLKARCTWSSLLWVPDDVFIWLYDYGLWACNLDEIYGISSSM